MRKIKLLLSFLTLFMGGNYVSAQLTSGTVYWIQDTSTKQFISQGDNWCTKAVTQDVGGLGFEAIYVSDGVYTLKNIMWNTVKNANLGLGADQFVDQDPVNYNITASGIGYLISYNGKYLVNNSAENEFKEKPIGLTENSAEATVWKFLTKTEYDAAIQAYKDSKAATYAVNLGYSASTVADLETILSKDYISKSYTSSITNPTLGNNDAGWEHGKLHRGNGSGGWAVGDGCAEFWNGCGYARQTVTGLPNGLYKVTFVGTYRPDNNGPAANLPSEKTSSPAFVYANDAKIEFIHWIDVPAKANGRSGITAANGYESSFYTYVSNGTLNLGVVANGWTGNYNWNPFGQFTLSYYTDQVSDDDATTILNTANSIKNSKMNKNVLSTLTSAISTFEASKTIANFNALTNAINAANTSIATYAALATAIENAYKPAFTASQTLYNDVISAAQSVYDNAEVDDCAATINTLNNDILAVYENDYSVFANNYQYDYSTLLKQDMTLWASTDYVTMTANEHWNGLNSQRYYEQKSSEWGQNSWSHAASETAILPAGNYVMSITARASVDVTSTMSVKVGDNAAITVSLPNKGASGYGIMTNGTGSYQNGIYANGGAGYGWEYRFIAFEVTEDNTSVTISLSSSTNAVHNWVSLASPLLKGDVHPNQIKLNQIKGLLNKLTGYETQITADTYATFAEHIQAANDATVKSTNLDDIIAHLQADIAIAAEEVAAFERGAAMNALINGANSVVLDDKATAANWTPAPDLNTWSTEADNTGMVTPFLQNWIGNGNTLDDNSLAYHSIRGIQDGFYEVSALVRIYSESGDEPSATSAVFTVNGETVDLLDGTSFVFNNMKGIYKNVSVKLQLNDALNIGLAYSGANFNWIAWKNLKVTYLGTKVADNEDYTALDNAITTAEAKVLGFEKDEFAPYNNIDALAALAAAQAINPAETNIKESVNAVTDELNNAVWTANAEEVNAIYDGTFANASNDGAPAGWVTDHNAGLGGAYHARTFVLNPGDGNYDNLDTFDQGDGVRSAFYIRFDGTNSAKTTKYTYGTTNGYTIPLKTNTIYKLNAQAGGWGKSNTSFQIAIVNSVDENIVAQNLGTPSTAISSNGDAIDYEMFFIVPTAGDYKLVLTNGNSSEDNAVVISNIKLFSTDALVFADGAVPTYAPGTYPAVKIDRSLTADKWATAVYPFAVSGVEKIAVLDSYDATTGQLNFKSAKSSAANVPFLMRSNAGLSEISLNNVNVEAINETPSAVASELHFIGSYAETEITNEQKNYVLKDNYIHPVGENPATINPYRAYFQVDQEGQEGEARALTLFIDGEVTGISELVKMNNEQHGQVYDLQGRKVEKTAKGLYILNGKKVVVK